MVRTRRPSFKRYSDGESDEETVSEESSESDQEEGSDVDEEMGDEPEDEGMDMADLDQDQTRPLKAQIPTELSLADAVEVQASGFTEPRPREHMVPEMIYEMPVKSMPQPQKKEGRSKSAPAAPVSDDDDSWRPTQPIAMDLMDDEIVDPTSPVTEFHNNGHTQGSSRRPSLRIVLNRAPSSPPPFEPLTQGSVELGNTQIFCAHGDSQGSVELGDNHRFQVRRPSTIPETQFSKKTIEITELMLNDDGDENDADYLSSQIVPESSYFDRASQNLQGLSLNSTIIRSKSAFVKTPHTSEKDQMAGGITFTSAFQHTISPPQSRSKSSGLRDTLITATPKSQKSLQSLTRRASNMMGTLPSGKKRAKSSIIYQPPFKKEELRSSS